jgi:two-component system response regulator
METTNGVEILLVEDNLSDAELTIRALKKKNLANRLIHLKDGVEALDFIYARGSYSHRNPYDTPKVILLDLKMPKINGIEVLTQLRADEKTKMVPVVILTSSKEDPDIDACYRIGINSYIVKPVEFGSFLNTVSELGLYWLLLNHPPGPVSKNKQIKR